MNVAEFDRLVGALEGLPDVVEPRHAAPGRYIIQTYRRRDKGETIGGDERHVHIKGL